MTKNNRTKLLSNLELGIFLLIWFIVFISPIIAQSANDDLQWQHIFFHWKRLFPFLVISLINHFVLVPLFFLKKKQAFYIVSVILLMGISVFSIHNIQKNQNDKYRKILKQEFRPDGKPTNKERAFRNNNPNRGEKKQHLKYRGKFPETLPIHVNIGIIVLLIIGFDTGLLIIFKWTKSEQERNKLEKEHLNSQLAFLRNQVSPHFFMNTLNNIHALIDIDSDEAKNAVIQLSKLMRHLLYESEADKIPLQKEINFIQHFIDLMRLRYNEKVDIQFKITEPLPECSIPPLLFTSFLENAFKHGVSYQEASFIHVSISGNNKQLIFKIKNSNPKLSKNHEGSGIGIKNSIKRLNLIYKDQYTLEVSDKSDQYSVNLILPL